MAKTSAEIRNNIKSFTTNRDALRDMAHNILVDILLHAAPEGTHIDAGASGDTTLALAMLKEMPKSWAEQARAWFDTFSPIRAIPQRDKSGMAAKYKELGDKGSPGFIEDKDERTEARLAWWKVTDAIETPFYKVIEEPEAKSYGADFLNGIFDAQIKVIEGKLEKGKIKPEAIALAHSTIAKLRMAKALSVDTVEPASNDEGAKVEEQAA